MKHILALAVIAASAATVPATFATGPQWTALIAYDDGGVAPQMLPIAADSEADCLAAVSSYRGAEVIEPCQPTASAITDPNDANRTSKTPRPKQPRNPDPAPTGNGSSGGGGGGGGGSGW
ncbi:hypothetical protein [Lysobacter brunescens]|uniref:Uncharacterized protein n=1 Tax=Lysobacter brunescens TaxID=262323 RepID=A0ABW2YGY1_9GAMM